MNSGETSKQLLFESEDCFNGRSAIAIAYDWKFMPPGLSGCHLLLTVARVEGKLRDGSALQRSKAWLETDSDKLVITYRMSFPAGGMRPAVGDLTGNVGLLGPHNPGTSERSGIFERTLSDAILWKLSTSNLIRSSVAEQPIVLCQGPLLPRLRGRMFYRCLMPEIVLLFITSDARWLQSLVSSSGGGVTTSQQRASITWNGPIPPLQVDAGSRAFFARSGEYCHHVEVVANTLFPNEEIHAWWNNRARLCSELFDDDWRLDEDGPALRSDPMLGGLPIPLAAAKSLAAKRLRDVWDFEVGVANSYGFAIRAAHRIRSPAKDAKIAAPLEKWNQLRKLVFPAMKGSTIKPSVTLDEYRVKCVEKWQIAEVMALLRDFALLPAYHE
ncbi:MAG: hypothetical protein DWQ45_22180 [Planctomycetota bacterium]|nr:MAG: hypothetical protein DWQ45_22180 [Planctomycetota bacterium]